MGFFSSLFGGKTRCPLCGTEFARTESSRIRCATPGCANYDSKVVEKFYGAPAVEIKDPVEIHYVNFEGAKKRFLANRASLHIKGVHLSAEVAPTGKRIALKLNNIANQAALLDIINQQSGGGDEPPLLQR